ncbi:hypothetical protein BH10ACI2_BH10ACI2_14520 [soil metagenome]
MKSYRPNQLAAAGIIAAAFILLRISGLTSSCLWFDEIFTVHAAEHDWSDLFSFVALDLIHPPLFYVLLKLWIAIGGEGLLWLRLLPFGFAVLSLPAFFLLCRELEIKPWTQILALVLISVNGSLIKYAQEVRMYSALICLSLLSIWLFARYFRRGKSIVPLVIINICLVYIHYFGALVFGSEIAVILIFQRTNWRRVVLMSCAVFASFAPWIIAVFGVIRAGQDVGENISWIKRPGIREIKLLLIDLVEPFYFQATTSDPVTLLKVAGPIFLLTLLACMLLLIGWKKQVENDKQNVYFVSIFILLPIAISFVASWILPYSVWGTRHLIIIFFPAAILIAHGFMTIWVKWLRILLITLLLLFKCFGFVTNISRPFATPIWCGYDALTQKAVTDEAAPIYVFEDLIAYHVWFTLRNDPNRVEIYKINDFSDMQEDKAFFLPRGFDGVSKINFVNVKDEQLWIIYRTKEWDPDISPIREFSDAGYVVDDKMVFESDIANVYAVHLKRPSG